MFTRIEAPAQSPCLLVGVRSDGRGRHPRRMSHVGYKPTWAGQVETQPSPLELHALITPPEFCT